MNRKFLQHFAPHLGLMPPDEGMFREHIGDNTVDQVHFMANHGHKNQSQRLARHIRHQSSTRLSHHKVCCAAVREDPVSIKRD